eukprot:UN29714
MTNPDAPPRKLPPPPVSDYASSTNTTPKLDSLSTSYLKDIIQSRKNTDETLIHNEDDDEKESYEEFAKSLTPPPPDALSGGDEHFDSPPNSPLDRQVSPLIQKSLRRGRRNSYSGSDDNSVKRSPDNRNNNDNHNKTNKHKKRMKLSPDDENKHLKIMDKGSIEDSEPFFLPSSGDDIKNNERDR